MSTRPQAIDFSHHLSNLARARRVSPLKDAQKYLGQPGMIELTGGLPSPAYFPFNSLSAEVLSPDAFDVAPETASTSTLGWLWNLLWRSSKTRTLVVPKFDKEGGADLANALQYSPADGQKPLKKFLREFTEHVYRPAYADFTTLVHCGNTDGWFKAASLLLNPGSGYLCEEWSYPSAMAASLPMGLKPVPVKLDSEGMLPEDLRFILETWDESERGCKRPHVMYTIPVGQNPSGTTMLAHRKQEIYAICVQYDIIIVEDDPYYFLQVGDYVPKTYRQTDDDENTAVYLDSLAPSYIRFDWQGRVIRLDSFSKTIAPGFRVGWFTCNPLFAERLERQGETSSQFPSGLSQAVIETLMLRTWQFGGYVRWLQGMRAQYRLRRDIVIDAFADEFLLESYVGTKPGVWRGATVLEGVSRPRHSLIKFYDDEKFDDRKLFSFAVPTAGMFVWVRVHLENHPNYPYVSRTTDVEAEPETLEQALWNKFAKAGLLVAPGWWFSSHREQELPEGKGHFRFAFSSASPEELRKGVKLFRQVLTEFFESA